MQLEDIQIGDSVYKPSSRLINLAANSDTVLKVDGDGLPEVWLGERIWLVGAHEGHKPGDSLDPYKPYARKDGATGPVVNVMEEAEAAYIRAYAQQSAA